MPQNNSKTRTHEQGVALITAIIIVSMASIAAVAMTHDLQLSIRRTGNIQTADQGYFYTLGSEAWSRGMLIRDLKNRKKKEDYDGLDEDWAKELPPTPLEGGEVRAITTDLQARFNLNNLYQDKETKDEDKKLAASALAIFQRLLARLELPESIAQATADWLDGNVNALFPNGAEDMEYLSLDPPYRTANGRMASPTELRLIKGVDQEAFEKLAPYITALPERSAINVNTADKLLIQALFDGLDEAGAELLLSEREEEPFTETQTFFTRLNDILDKNKVESEKMGPLVSVDSHFFQLETVVRMENSSQRLVSLLHKSEKDVVVVSRTIGAY
ncbi:MAG: type II secretion system minor pseudopilin GspK [Candidatus Thiodiazotropha sp. (ex Epidulcina cf. delphinae)]|nr:type II secretion system minor pseudopilin GspK [Candidatus Thiodiazotropha sp. (ex Epidulcina cf. delphinae)]